MVYCINAELAFQSQAAADLIFGNLVAGIGQGLRFGAEQFDKAPCKFGPFGMFVIMRFRVRTDAVAFRDLIEAQGLIRTPRPGSFYRIHDCSHDDAGSCEIGTLRVW